MALDLVAFRKELGEGARALRGLSLSRHLARIARVFAFDFVIPYPELSTV